MQRRSVHSIIYLVSLVWVFLIHYGCGYTTAFLSTYPTLPYTQHQLHVKKVIQNPTNSCALILLVIGLILVPGT
jgi:hypothetical protein